MLLLSTQGILRFIDPALSRGLLSYRGAGAATTTGAGWTTGTLATALLQAGALIRTDRVEIVVERADVDGLVGTDRRRTPNRAAVLNCHFSLASGWWRKGCCQTNRFVRAAA